MRVHGESAVYCTSDLNLTVNKPKKKKNAGKEHCQCTEVSVYAVYTLSTVKTENTYTLARLEALFKSSQSSPSLSRLHLYIRTIQHSKSKFFLRANAFAIHPEVSRRDLQCCLSCPLAPPTDVFLVSSVV